MSESSQRTTKTKTRSEAGGSITCPSCGNGELRSRCEVCHGVGIVLASEADIRAAQDEQLREEAMLRELMQDEWQDEWRRRFHHGVFGLVQVQLLAYSLVGDQIVVIAGEITWELPC